MWNDRDCNAKNYFICETPLDGRLQGNHFEEGQDRGSQDSALGGDQGECVCFGLQYLSLI